MISRYASGLAALALLAVAGGCGGGGGDGAAGGGDIPREPRTFQFTVTVPSATGTLGDPRFFVDQALTQPGVEIRSQTQRIDTTGASVNGDQQRVTAIAQPFRLVVHFDASGSIDDNGRDPSGDRFTAASGLIGGVGSAAGSTQTRVYTFRSTYTDDFKLLSPVDFGASNGSARTSALDAARAEGARDNSPALTATYNIINALPAGRAAMLLLTDGENNAESGTVVPGCGGGEGAGGPACNNVTNVVNLANQLDVRVFVAGLGNDDQALSKFGTLARDTRAAFVKATRSGTLDEQFNAVGRLMLSGGVVVPGETSEVNVPRGSNPFVRGWMRFDRPSGGCPGSSEEVNGTSFCRIRF